jgi:putative transposase
MHVETIEAKACIDHIHMCLSIPSKYAVSDIIGYLKEKIAIEVFEKYSKLRQNFRGHKFWARGYYVNTVGLNEAVIRKYIQNQEETDRIEDSVEPKNDDSNLF